MVPTGRRHHRALIFREQRLRGCERLKANRACILAQDEASSVVWGMPGAVVAAGLADMSVGLQEMAGEIIRRLGRGGVAK